MHDDSLFIRVSDAGPARAAALTAAVLLRGDLAIIPTDTVYGIAAHPESADGVARLFSAKHRDPTKPIPLLAAGLREIRTAGAIVCSLGERLAESFWPGPLTLVMDTPYGTEGFRVPRHDVTLALLRGCGGVLRVTSANAAGEPPATSATGAAAALGHAVSAVLDDGPAPGGVPSTVVAIRDGTLQILREGALSQRQLEDALRSG